MEIKRTVSQEIEYSIKCFLQEILRFIGDDPSREGLVDTPNRMIRSWDKIFGGYKEDPQKVLERRFQAESQEMVILQDVEFYSTCEHHFLPFYGKVHIGYIPSQNIVGISKLARLVEVYSRRLQIQERMTTQIANDIEKYLEAQGVIVIVKAQHFCMTSRGVEKQNSKMITSAIRGNFIDGDVRKEFMDIINKG